jgi:hypothetical protein
MVVKKMCAMPNVPLRERIFMFIRVTIFLAIMITVQFSLYGCKNHNFNKLK